MISKFHIIILLPLVMLAFVVIGLGMIIFNYNGILDDFEKNSYKSFKQDTEVIEGKVVKSERESKLIFPDSYNLIVDIGDESNKMLKASEQEYRDYQTGSYVKFRIDTGYDNDVVVDLNKDKDIKTEKEYSVFDDKAGRVLFSKIFLNEDGN